MNLKVPLLLIFPVIGIVILLIFLNDKSTLISLEGERVELELGQFGRDVRSDTKTTTIEFVNQSSKPLEIEGWRKSCGCVIVSPNRVVVQSGERLLVEVALDMKMGGLKSAWISPKLAQVQNPTVVNFLYEIVSANNHIRITSSIVILGEDGRGTLTMICVSPSYPTSELLITVSKGLESKLSEWSEITTQNDTLQVSRGRLWQSTVEIFGFSSDTAWVKIDRKEETIGRYPVR